MEITFPVSTAPGVNPTEGGGRLINAYADTGAQGGRSGTVWRRAAGLRQVFELTGSHHRGAITVGSVLYAVTDDKLFSIVKGGSGYIVTECTGTVGGFGAIYMARNMNTTTQVLIVHS